MAPCEKAASLGFSSMFAQLTTKRLPRRLRVVAAPVSEWSGVFVAEEERVPSICHET